MRFFRLTIIAIVIGILHPYASDAQEPSQAPQIKQTSSINELTECMQKNPNDLDAFFKYAQFSARTGLLENAENAYLHMLTINPNQNRVKAALAIIYLKMDKKEKAKALLLEVLDDNPPPKVRANLEQRLAAINKEINNETANASKTTPPAIKEKTQLAKSAPKKYSRNEFLMEVKKRTDPNFRPESTKEANNTGRLTKERVKTSQIPQKPTPPTQYTRKKLLNEVKKRTTPENRPENIKKKKAKEEEELAKLEPAARKAREQLIDLKEKVKKTPNNLDAYFSLAKLAEKLGDNDTAKEAYLHMLSKQPKLDRVRLDLGLIYVKTGEFEKAKSLFESVLANNPPDKVKENINNLLARVKQAMKTHIISGSVSYGVNRDSNATSAASTGETTFSDISIPLADNSTEKEDAQHFATMSLSHIYKFNNDNSKIWSATFNTTGTLYKTSQTTEHQLDIGLASVKAGPTLNLNRLKTQISVAGNLSIINLNSFKYLKTRGGELTLKYSPTNKLILDNTTAYEYRYFYNSPTATNTTRTGNAYQNKIGATYVLTEKDILTSSLTWRNESAREARYAFDQINLSLGYIRQLPYDMTVNAAAAFKSTHYDDFDTTISSSILRRDLEKTFTLTLLKKLPKNITFTTSYQYKNANSNIQNYTYDNHRVSGAFGWSF